MIADYGAADGVNSNRLFERIVRYIHGINPSLNVRLVYIDIADPAAFNQFWADSHLSELKHVEAEYIRRSFYEPFPELAGRLNIGFSSTALHWMDTETVDADSSGTSPAYRQTSYQPPGAGSSQNNGSAIGEYFFANARVLSSREVYWCWLP
ncbi:MAG: hypothetical protein KO206_03635 [Methanomicrobiaceae archaeon]|uniref:Uncharacterized protein n=1 Tax=hydrocarbon metagenome TaxID=938273 RepID=A0A0W8FEB7_9ZZZZ|nr:hypothetical protein [Methanomicrobiaceae archaeon]